MRLLEKICKELGVEIGEEWLGSNGYYYTITKESDIKVRDPEDKEPSGESLVYWDDILTDKVKPVWKPRKGEDYSIPDTSEEKLYRSRLWGGFKDEEMLLERGLIFKTEEEAIECANKMLESIRKC